MTLAIVEGVSAASTACEREVSVQIGGRTGGGWLGDILFGGPSGLSLGDDRVFGAPFAFSGGDGWALPRPLKEPSDPDNLLVKLLVLLWVDDDLLETVDWDQRFKFPIPSLTPLPLSNLG